MSSDIKLEDLLALLKEEEIPQLESEPTDLDLFIFDFKITPSETQKVRTSVIYAFYLAWKDAGFGTDYAPIGDRLFFKMFSQKFKRHRWGSRRFYMIEQEPFEVTRWQLEEIKRNIQRRKRRVQQEGEQGRLRRERQRKKGI